MDSGKKRLWIIVGALALGAVWTVRAVEDQPAEQPIVLETPPSMPFVEGSPASASGDESGRAVRRGGFVSVQVNVDALGNNIPGDAANEPSMAVDPTNPDNIVIGWRQFDSVLSDFRQAGWGYSHDGGQTWTFPGVLEPGVFRSDPVLRPDADGVVHYNSLSISPSYACDDWASFDGGVTWEDPHDAFGGDKAWITIDTTGGIGHGHIYAAWSNGAGCCGNRTFTRSTDGGVSFIEPIRIDPIIPVEVPVFGTLDVGPDGELYVAGISGASAPNDDFLVAKSTNAQDPEASPTFDFLTHVDLGGSLLFEALPNPGGLLGQVWLVADRSDGPTRGNVYLLCSVDPPGNDPLDVRFARSEDGGLTFSDSLRINDDASGTNAWQWFGTMGVAPNGRLDVVWNDTRNDATVNTSELFYASSTDGGLTWSENIAISEPFDQSLGYPVQQKLGDYYDITSTNEAVHIAYAATFNLEQDVYYLRLDVAQPPPICEGDANGDGLVDPLDAGFALARFGCAVGAGDPDCDASDQNADGVVDPLDVGFILARFGVCPS